MADQQHRHQHDQVAEQHGEHRLPRRHALLDQPGREHVRRDVHHHADPQRREVIPAPRALRGGGRREVVVVQAAGAAPPVRSAGIAAGFIERST
jgi:hypothetical protein